VGGPEPVAIMERNCCHISAEENLRISFTRYKKSV